MFIMPVLLTLTKLPFTLYCRDLQDICEAQLQFAPRAAAPTFGGAKGVETSKSIADMQVNALHGFILATT